MLLLIRFVCKVLSKHCKIRSACFISYLIRVYKKLSVKGSNIDCETDRCQEERLSDAILAYIGKGKHLLDRIETETYYRNVLVDTLQDQEKYLISDKVCFIAFFR